MRKNGFLMPVLFGLLLTGCSPTFPAMYAAVKDYKLPEGKKEGMVIMSFTQPFSQLNWMYREIREDKGWGAWQKYITTSHINNQLIDYGNTMIYATDLPEGEYEIFRWSQPENKHCNYYSGFSWLWLDLLFTHHYYRSTNDFSMRFKCIAGKASYLGNVYLRFAGNRFNILIRDNSDEELPLFRKNYSNIREDQIEVHLMDQGEDKLMEYKEQ